MITRHRANLVLFMMMLSVFMMAVVQEREKSDQLLLFGVALLNGILFIIPESNKP